MRDADEGVRVQDDDAPAPACEHAGLLPSTEGAADGVQRRAGHLGDLPPGDRELDLDAVRRPPSGLTDQAEQVTGAAREQAAAVEEVLRSVVNAREQVRQITAAMEEQTKQGREIAKASEDVTEQVAAVARAVKEQQAGIEEIVKGIVNTREQFGEVSERLGEHAEQGERLLALARNVTPSSATTWP